MASLTDKSKDAKPEIVVWIKCEIDNGYGHVVARVGVRDPRNEEGFNTQCSCIDSLAHPEKLCLWSQCSRGYNGRTAREDGLYAIEVIYTDPYCLDVHKVQAMAKTLTAIDRKMQRMASVEGHAADYGTALNRFARAIGAKRIYVKRPCNQHWISWTLKDARWAANELVNDCFDHLDGTTTKAGAA